MSEESFSKLCSVWNVIGPFNMDLFSHRLILQKKVFLLQAAGMDLGYTFRKYIRGPYCSSLTNDGYKVKAAENISGTNGCSEKGIKIVLEIGKGHENDHKWFELIATIVYYYKTEHLNRSKIKETIFEEKPHLANDSLFDEAYGKLVSLELVS
ncbi:MAG: hypothetical protein KKE50_01820 [Nanoarchaeota archaeon]|nr:hypothetical protein [Nanoarchaeota archaeon]